MAMAVLLAPARPASAGAPLRCVAFGPYVGDLDPDVGRHPSPQTIDALLDALVAQTGAQCIQTYGVLNGLDYTIESANRRSLKVIAILWLDTDPTVNNQSVQRGIQLAKAYPDTIVRLSCGSEYLTRNQALGDSVLRACVTQLRQGGVTQPITAIDTWWVWCNRSWPCRPSSLAGSVDWIGVNVFPWWENEFSGLPGFTCTPAEKAADFNVARVQDVAAVYKPKEVVLTEFGWPAGPDGATEVNQFTGEHCGVAGEANQRRVVRETLAKLDQQGLSGVLFEAFREGAWKARSEHDPVGPFWGVCTGAKPYACEGYDVLVSDRIYRLGLAPDYGPASAWMHPVRIAATPNGDGYYVLGRDGGVFAFGNAPFLDSIPGLPPPYNVAHGGAIAMAVTPTGKGYYILTGDGGVFTFGDAHFYGSIPGLPPPYNVAEGIDLAVTPTGKGYYVLARDGGVFSFGEVQFYGSMPGLPPPFNRTPVTRIALTPTGRGYYILGEDGGIFAFGDAVFRGSIPGLPPPFNAAHGGAMAITVTPTGKGYRVLTGDGGVFAFGDAVFVGSVAGQAGTPALDMAALRPEASFAR
ncbi:MAG TPA: hypothetical protein VFC93_05390 [Chloroflexota bacterium]|nr:hypothetical protein [Chloroflexota bacterium]